MEVTATGDAVDTADVVVGVVDFVGVEEGGVSGVGGKNWVATDNHHGVHIASWGVPVGMFGKKRLLFWP